ncbi:MAG: hypothetical protein R3Y52_02625 [Psittacicella sp.]
MSGKIKIFGNPLNHSISPRMQTYFANSCNISNFSYLKCEVKNNFFKILNDFFCQDFGVGCNITAPYKKDSYLYIKEVNPSGLSFNAEQAKSCNTIYRLNGHLYGDTTDGTGLLSDLKRLGILKVGDKVLILGAGGVVSSILSTLSFLNLDILLVNRNYSKVRNLGIQFNVSFDAIDNLKNIKTKFDLVINCISTKDADFYEGIVSHLYFQSNFFYDVQYLLYGLTPFLKSLKNKGVSDNVLFDGYGMLIFQGVESFKRWFNLTPEYKPLLKNRKLLLALK